MALLGGSAKLKLWGRRCSIQPTLGKMSFLSTSLRRRRDGDEGCQVQSETPAKEEPMPASTTQEYLDALLEAIRLESPEEAIMALRARFPLLDIRLIAADVRWGRDLRQRGYGRREILEDLHLA
jgi:hypothetical protein